LATRELPPGAFRHVRDEGRHHCRLAYEFYHNDELIFEGDDFGSSPMHSIDGDETVAALLSFLSLKPGDTDREYFESYTPRQMEWCQEHGEEVGAYPDGARRDRYCTTTHGRGHEEDAPRR
jgi:hypothetical protein